LPDEIRNIPELVNGADQNDAVYQGMVAAIVSLVFLNNGVLPEGIDDPDTAKDRVNDALLDKLTH
jgi:hypothetical protein